MKLRIEGKIIEFGEVEIIGNNEKPIYKILNYENDDFFSVVKMCGEFEEVEDVMKCDNVILVK